jgi:hypothetical protein
LSNKWTVWIHTRVLLRERTNLTGLLSLLSVHLIPQFPDII